MSVTTSQVMPRADRVGSSPLSIYELGRMPSSFRTGCRFGLLVMCCGSILRGWARHRCWPVRAVDRLSSGVCSGLGARGRVCLDDVEAISHAGLMSAIETRVSDRHLLKLLRALLRARVMQDGAVCHGEAGTPQGGVVSPGLCNVYRHGLDLRRAKPGAVSMSSRSCWASRRCWSFLSDWFSIWRIRSRVTLNVRPTSSRVHGCSPPRP